MHLHNLYATAALSTCSYVLAIYCTMPLTLSNFVVARYPHVHWSTYIVVRTGCTATISAVALTVTGHWTHKASPDQFVYRVKGGGLNSMWISVLAYLVYESLTNIFR